MMAASEETSCISLHLAKTEKEAGPEEGLPSKTVPQAMSVTLESECKELWRQFDSIGTEMIVTRRGRCVLGLVSCLQFPDSHLAISPSFQPFPWLLRYCERM